MRMIIRPIIILIINENDSQMQEVVLDFIICP